MSHATGTSRQRERRNWTAMIPIQTAITGQEELGGIQEPTQALAEFYRAFNSRNLALMEQNWSDADDVIMDNPLGGVKRGWNEIRPIYERIFRGQVKVEFYDYTIHLADGTFYAVGRERNLANATDGEGNGIHRRLAIRTTRIFRWNGERWRQVHHHGSFEDPVLLAEYQKAVLGPGQEKSQKMKI